jgi:Domain of unknown function (DUF6898)
MSKNNTPHEIFFEFTRMDASLRVCAIDSVTGIEVVTVLPSTIAESEAKKVALKKLLWRLERENKSTEEGGDAPHPHSGKYI